MALAGSPGRHEGASGMTEAPSSPGGFAATLRLGLRLPYSVGAVTVSGLTDIPCGCTMRQKPANSAPANGAARKGSPGDGRCR